MKQAPFEAAHAREWGEFEAFLEKKPSFDPAELPARFRRVCQSLALAAERHYSTALVDRLNRLALRGHHALYANQPQEGTAGPTNEELIATGRSVGLGDAFATCVNDGKYETWPDHTTDAASARGVSGTPSVFVNGTKVDPTLAAVTAAIAAAGGPTPSAS